jgi:hypothetical protein
MPTSAFKELELTCLSPEQRKHVFHSSGTTEQKPSRHFHNRESLLLYEAALRPWFQIHFLPSLEFPQEPLDGSRTGAPRFVILTPSPAAAPHSSLVHMFDTVRLAFASYDSIFTGVIDPQGLRAPVVISGISQPVFGRKIGRQFVVDKGDGGIALQRDLLIVRRAHRTWSAPPRAV